ncbi:unnamed protein product [Symbiodinium natans]|uniref:Uncharacterized protein n=1 Tax=Symbiodinium natans TaxID=878477 RepID=A0A812R174_9DINO|nr:unnamed protein product [Symbiodinium natans]
MSRDADLATEIGKQGIMRREILAGTSLDNLTLWQSCRDVALADCCRLGRLRVNDGQGSCRCANSSTAGGEKRLAAICSLRWQVCSVLQKESCCSTTPASLLVAFGNSSASGFASHCACANATFAGLTQEAVEGRCARELKGTCSGTSLFFKPLANVSARIGHKHFHNDGGTHFWSFASGGCPSAASLHFTPPVREGRDYVLRVEARPSLQPESTKAAPALRLTIGNSSFAMPVRAQPKQPKGRYQWLEHQFRGLSEAPKIWLHMEPGNCVDVGRIQMATCAERLKALGKYLYRNRRKCI